MRMYNDNKLYFVLKTANYLRHFLFFRISSTAVKGTDNDNLVIDSEDIVESSEESRRGSNNTPVYPDLSEKTDIRFHLSKSKYNELFSLP